MEEYSFKTKKNAILEIRLFILQNIQMLENTFMYIMFL